MERRTVGLSVKNLGRKMLIAAVSTLLISTVAIPGAEAAMSDREQGNIADYWNGINNWENIDNYASGKNPLYPWLYWSLGRSWCATTKFKQQGSKLLEKLFI